MALTCIVTFLTHALQILFGAVVLGLSIKALGWQQYGKSPATHGYGAFVGAFALLVGLIGLAACFALKLEKPMLIADAVTAAMLFAGGVTYTVQLRGVDCGNALKEATFLNKLIDAGARKYWRDEYNRNDDYYRYQEEGLLKRCKMVEANAAFLFLGFSAAVGSIVLGVLVLRKARRSYGTAGGV